MFECALGFEEDRNISSAGGNLAVLARPVVEMSNSSLSVREGAALELTCISNVVKTGHPKDSLPPTIVWYRHDEEIKPGDGWYIYGVPVWFTLRCPYKHT